MTTINSVGRVLSVLVLAVSISFAATRASEAQDEKLINVMLSNESITLPTGASTVHGFLGELSIDDLPSGAKVDPPLDSNLHDGMTIFLPDMTVTRGTTERLIPTEVRFEERIYDGPEQCLVEDPGQEGLIRSELTIFFVDGQEVGRRQRDEAIRPMEPKVMVCYRNKSRSAAGKGYKSALQHGEGPSAEEILEKRYKPGTFTVPPSNYVRKLTMHSTAYEPGPRSCGKSANGICASGMKAGYGVVAIDNDVFKFGTRFFIEGYGYAVAGDTGSAIDGNDIDVCFLTVDECLQWGRKDVTVYVLD